MESSFDTVFFIIFGLIVATFLFKMFKHGGFKGAMFGASIKNTIGEVAGSGSKIMKLSLKVHELDDETQEKAVGLELVAKSLGSFQMTPIALSVSEAKKLAELLNSATNGK